MSRSDETDGDETASSQTPAVSLQSREQMSWTLIAIIGALALSPIILNIIGVTTYRANPGVLMAIGSVLIAIIFADRIAGQR